MGLFVAFLERIGAIKLEIYTAFADRIGIFADTGDWALLAAYLPVGMVFGAIHAMTPGHSNLVLATYLAGSTGTTWRGLLCPDIIEVELSS